MAKILIVDDDGDLRTLLGLCFLRCGHSIIVASNGAEGLTCVTAHAPDLVVTDLNMPVMDGLELLRQLRANGHRDLPAIVLTARSRSAPRRPPPAPARSGQAGPVARACRGGRGADRRTTRAVRGKMTSLLGLVHDPFPLDVLTLWLLPCAIQDRRTRHVSNWLTVPLFIARPVAILTDHFVLTFAVFVGVYVATKLEPRRRGGQAAVGMAASRRWRWGSSLAGGDGLRRTTAAWPARCGDPGALWLYIGCVLSAGAWAAIPHLRHKPLLLEFEPCDRPRCSRSIYLSGHYVSHDQARLALRPGGWSCAGAFLCR